MPRLRREQKWTRICDASMYSLDVSGVGWRGERDYADIVYIVIYHSVHVRHHLTRTNLLSPAVGW